MAFFCFPSRSKHFHVTTFMKTFRGHKSQFRKLSHEQLTCLLQQGFTHRPFPVEKFIDFLIECHWNFNAQLKGGCLPLNLACSHGNLRIVKKMIAAGANVHAKDDFGALDYACRSGNLELVRYLLSLNVEINTRSSSGQSPIFAAVIFGHYDIFEYLIEKGADIETPNERGTTLLHTAASHKSLAMVEKLVELGADIEAQDNFGKNVLGYASLLGHHEMMKRLIELGAPVAKYCENSDYCCDMAIIYNDVDLLKLFIANGAKLERNHLNLFFCINDGAEYGYRDDESCYDAADYKQTSLHMIEYLLTLGMDINQQCPSTGRTPLMQVCLNGTLEQVKLLLKHGADCSLADSEGRTALHYAAHGGNSDIVVYLIQNCKMDPNIRSSNGQTPLHMFREHTNTPTTLKTLVNNGADINAQDTQHQTPLHVFTQTGYHQYVGFLLQHGARNDIFDKNHNRPIDLCLQNTAVRKVYAKYSIYQFTVLESLLLCLS